ncbi:hypothetical protein B0H14DRAFT_2631468 [Mycena olivaceomarginata]|nr:hypothetical protein B0H14DRAFT_2631468 [Mycena olivaceomarginata]
MTALVFGEGNLGKHTSASGTNSIRCSPLRQFATLPQYLKGSRKSIAPIMTRRHPLPDTNLQSHATGEPHRGMAWGARRPRNAGFSVGSFGLTRHMIVQWIQKARTTRNPLSGPKIVAQPQIVMVAGQDTTVTVASYDK